MAPTPSPQAHTRNRLLRLGLQDSYPIELMQDFLQFVTDNTECLPESSYPKQVTQTLSKFLFFANAGLEFSWLPVHDAQAIGAWLRRLTEAGCSPSSLCGRLKSIRLACDFLFERQRRPKPPGLADYLELKSKLYHRRRKARESSRLLSQATPRSELQAIRASLFENHDLTARWEDILERATRSRRLSEKEFLFGLRHTLCCLHLQTACRPSALYTLTVGQVRAALNDSPPGATGLVVPNACHKTGASRGPTLLVLDQAAKALVVEYMDTIRPLCPSQPSTEKLFLNTKGKALTSSQVSRHMKSQQRLSGWDGKALTPTEFRKSVVTAIRSEDRRARRSHDLAISVALNHSERTSRHYYDCDARRQACLSTHGRIRSLLRPPLGN